MAPRRFSGGNRLKSRDAGAQDQDPCRRNGSGRRHHHGKQFRQREGCEQNRFVTGDAGHGRKDIHALGAGDARNEFEREQRCTGGCNFGGFGGSSQRFTHTDQNLTGTEQRKIVLTVDGVGAEGAGLSDDLSFLENFRPGSEGDTAAGVIVICEAGLESGGIFSDDFEACLL